ncbi:hypothetical protein EVAR_43259_1 [Eumeta japonica]|uniref:Uncharacterized protein n=1 Tax=Eumeta variegata TaxID=151549 RepID=A0A4C1WVZ3_EUMVA|nr:hypothetical protein EVAR_43259_1 [Eumeta japonica]
MQSYLDSAPSLEMSNENAVGKKALLSHLRGVNCLLPPCIRAYHYLSYIKLRDLDLKPSTLAAPARRCKDGVPAGSSIQIWNE